VSCNLFWMVFLPFLSSLLLGVITFFSKTDQYKIARIVAPLSIGISFVLALTMVGQFLDNPLHEPVRCFMGNWIEVGSLVISGTLHLDTLSSILTLIVTGIGFLIHVYSVGYMSHDEHQTKFFAYLNLFCGFMLVLITASSLPLLFVGWEGVGVCSFLLIGFWYQDQEKAFAGRKAFIVNRIGDAAFILAMALAFQTFGSLEFASFSPLSPEHHALNFNPQTLEWIAILLFIGCMGKSAQFPLYIWLPDAMAGPTPVSALIHAATMVTAGVYVLARCAHLYMQAEMASNIVAIIGLTTALFAAAVALFQKDIKKVLAFSTVSQLGFMVLAMGVGAYSVGIFHLITHAYFKALLFLGSGSVIHALHGEQDIHKMGGLKNYLMGTTIVFFSGYLAIIGFPFFAGWFSKDAIIHSVATSGHPMMFVLIVVSALLTTVYMTRLIALTFLGKSRLSSEQLKKVHESPNSMLIPMWILAALSIMGGWPILSFFGKLKALFPVHEHQEVAFGLNEHVMEWGVSGLVIALASLTIYLYAKKQPLLVSWAKASSKVSAAGEEEYYVNSFLVRVGNQIVQAFSKLTSFMDTRMIDNFLNSLAAFFQKLSNGFSNIQHGVPQTYVLYIVVGTVLLLYFIVGV
jgi:NADH-quinone oxidoreductase subunit L